MKHVKVTGSYIGEFLALGPCTIQVPKDRVLGIDTVILLNFELNLASFWACLKEG